MPPEGYASISVKEEVAERLRERKPTGVTLSRFLESIAFDETEAETEELERINDRLDKLAESMESASTASTSDTVDARIVDMDASERRAFAEEVAEVLR